MARSLSKTGKGFRSNNRQCSCLGARRPHPNPHAATRKSLKSNEIIMSRTLSSTLYIMRRNKGPEPFGTDGWEVFYACPGLTGSVDKDHRSTERGALRRSRLRM